MARELSPQEWSKRFNAAHVAVLKNLNEAQRREQMACECEDPGCVHTKEGHHGRSKTLYRIDMEDQTGTLMCMICRADAFESGLFTDEAPLRGRRA